MRYDLDWLQDVEGRAEAKPTLRENAPQRVLFEAGLVVAAALGLAALASLLVPLAA